MLSLMRAYIQLLSLLILLQITVGSVSAQSQVELVDAFPNLTFDRPVAVRNDGASNRLYVVEQFGRIHVMENSPDVTE